MNTGRKAWIVAFVFSSVGLLGVLGDLWYHYSLGMISEAIGETPLEMILHLTPAIALLIVFIISLTFIVRKKDN